MASIVEIIAEIGYEKLGVQRLSQCITGNQSASKRGGSRITFGTPQDLASVALGSKDALIVWVDTKELDAALDRLKARSGGAGELPNG